MHSVSQTFSPVQNAAAAHPTNTPIIIVMKDYYWSWNSHAGWMYKRLMMKYQLNCFLLENTFCVELALMLGRKANVSIYNCIYIVILTEGHETWGVTE